MFLCCHGFSKYCKSYSIQDLVTLLKKKGILNEAQCDFRNKRFTATALLELKDVTNALENKKHTAGVFIDLSKVFDTINHSLLL